MASNATQHFAAIRNSLRFVRKKRDDSCDSDTMASRLSRQSAVRFSVDATGLNDILEDEDVQDANKSDDEGSISLGSLQGRGTPDSDESNEENRRRDEALAVSAALSLSRSGNGSWLGDLQDRDAWANEGGDLEEDHLEGSFVMPRYSSSPSSSRASSRYSRCAITESSIQGLDFYDEYQGMVKAQRIKDWATQFRRTDPRFQILRFFNDVAQEGADKIEESGINPSMISPLLRAFYRANVFTVWRPTSDDAIRKMMLGVAVGKGLDVKGKSAKCGKLSGYVPFLQIHEEQHKKMVRTLPRNGRLRIFFSSRNARDDAAAELKGIAQEMLAAVLEAKGLVDDETIDEERREQALQCLLWDMDHPDITAIDDYEPKCFGMEVAERLFWEGFVMRRSCERVKGSDDDTGRPSEPAFQDMNFMALRKPTDDGPRPVIWQHSDASDPMCPLNLLMAYEENGRVLPVVSDFDCFLVGTRGVAYEEPMPPEQIEMVKWCVSEISSLLNARMARDTWTSRWLEVLKQKSSKFVGLKMPEFGFGDPKSYSIIEHAIKRLERDGCVRHGAECFNYYFPQELDDKYLVISDALPGKLQWEYMELAELQDFLCNRVDDGFTFPLHPKWILCDLRFKRVYDKLMASEKPNVQDSLKVWYPPESGIRERIEDIHKRHPRGFRTSSTCPILTQSQRFRDISQRDNWAEVYDGTAAMDLAELELKKHVTLQRAKAKLRSIVLMNKMLRGLRIAKDSEGT